MDLQERCVVCFEDPDVMSVLRCWHLLCSNCYGQLLMRRKALCPLCRERLKHGFRGSVQAEERQVRVIMELIEEIKSSRTTSTTWLWEKVHVQLKKEKVDWEPLNGLMNRFRAEQQKKEQLLREKKMLLKLVDEGSYEVQCKLGMKKHDWRTRKSNIT